MKQLTFPVLKIILMFSYRKTKKGGGVGIYISDKINFSVLDNLTYSSKHIERIFIRIDKEELKSIKDVIVGWTKENN